jgi:hypothetical protein
MAAGDAAMASTMIREREKIAAAFVPGFASGAR